MAKATRSIHVQTDLSWPDGQVAPCSLPSMPAASVQTSISSMPARPTAGGSRLSSPTSADGGRNSPSPIKPKRSKDAARKDNKRSTSAGGQASSSSPNKNQNKRKVIRLNRPPRHTDHPVTIYNKYETLDTDDSVDPDTDTAIR